MPEVPAPLASCLLPLSPLPSCFLPVLGRRPAVRRKPLNSNTASSYLSGLSIFPKIQEYQKGTNTKPNLVYIYIM